jgi:short subunit fatty acids transporter
MALKNSHNFALGLVPLVSTWFVPPNIIIIIIIIIVVVVVVVVMMPFMQGISSYIPETTHVSRAYSVEAILRALLMVHITLSSILNSFVLLH